MPDEYFRALEELEQGGLTSLEVKSTPDYVTHLVSLTEAGSIADTKQVNTAEKRLIKKIFKKWEDKTTSVIVGFTHQQLPFLLAQEGETISYALIGQVEEKNLF